MNYKMAEVTTYCNPGNAWAGCYAQRYNCPTELIEQTMADATAGHADLWDVIGQFRETMTAKGYKSAEYCDGCGSKYSG